MLILGIETSCDETSASVVRDGCLILSNIVSSQDKIHAPFGGVVPELASRAQIENIGWVVKEAIDVAKISLNKVDAVGVTYGPGLAGSLLVGVEFAKSLAYSLSIPLVPINHIHAHLYSAFLDGSSSTSSRSEQRGEIEFPYIGMVISGGHTTLFYVEDFSSYSLLGQTRDDASGEAFDKGAKILQLGYPGGPAIDRISREGNSSEVKFPRAYLGNSFDFSFSGLKTALLRYMEKRGEFQKRDTADIAASFQEAIVDVLIKKVILAAEKKKTDTIVIGGGVASNTRLREKLEGEAKGRNLRIHFPQPKLCTDNGAMVAGLSYWMLEKGRTASLDLDIQPNVF